MIEVIVVLVALAFGSFANVLIVRLPRGQSVVFGGSRCPRCGHAIRPWHNVPVLGWLVLRGRCHDCGKPISWRYPAVEASFALLALVFVQRFGSGTEALFCLAFALSLLLVAWADCATFLIFDAVTYPLAALGMAYSWLFPQRFLGWWESPLAAAGMAGGMALLMWSGRKWTGKTQAMGAGDLKLMSAAAAWLGLAGGLRALVYGVLAGLPFMLVFLAVKRRGNWRKPAPWGPGLAMGCALQLYNAMSGGELDPLLKRLWLDILMIRPS